MADTTQPCSVWPGWNLGTPLALGMAFSSFHPPCHSHAAYSIFYLIHKTIKRLEALIPVACLWKSTSLTRSHHLLHGKDLAWRCAELLEQLLCPWGEPTNCTNSFYNKLKRKQEGTSLSQDGSVLSSSAGLDSLQDFIQLLGSLPVLNRSGHC